MTIKYVYSALSQRFAYPRHIIKNDWGIEQLKPTQRGGSRVYYGRTMDTSNPFSTIDELIYERMYHEDTALAEEDYFEKGLVFISGKENIHEYKMPFLHRVRKPGTYYMIEYKKGSQTSSQPQNEDYSPLYETFKEAVHQIQKHVANNVKDLDDSKYELEINKDTGHTKLIYGSYDENGEIRLHSYIGEYIIIPFEISQETYDNANDVLDDKYAMITPWINFNRPEYTYPN